ncbi:DEAD/DEAH box helicase [Cryptosporangium phraense]|uniref:Probable helicase HelY n=1 Tax=Cryptosporangium phraense TaxID=2593070 RepID=A0A545AZJ3_9ACTN|nr:DEAD/DEAH box helicase [Cryptosporangium phraense]TQS46729.1 DEAD/DEAH box helicase [Cryptosporangium phraense]
MSSPAEQYAAARRRASYPAYTDFTAQLSFDLDDFQREACQALEDGGGVLVCAPTGAGKTVVGEFAVHLALRHGTKCFYTTPIKALSNQKYNDLVARYGAEQVGLLTGDNAINGDAPVVVMTTEVLRNMLYAGSAALTNLAFVVMDEVHYLADRFRGAVWEEVIIHLPESVALVSLSATVSNAEEFAEWLVTVRGDTAVVVSEHRPVPLWQHMLVGRRMFDLFTEKSTAEATQKDVDPDLTRFVRDQLRRVQYTRSGRPIRAKNLVPFRSDVIERLDAEGLLPAITFVFSRAGCDAAVQQCMAAGLRLTTPDERAEIRRIAEERTKDLAAEDLQVLGYWEWLDGLQRGLAAHHAGLLPVYKEVVEELFVRGLVKAVFATETLALGINMPARSVVLERLVKFNGETHVDLTAGEYTQLTGRAGRRGIDVEGHAVVVWSPEIDPRHVAGLASTRTYPLRSSFRPSYNMAVNLVGSVGRERARELLETSFAQFQADRAVVGLAKQAQRQHDALDAYQESMTCHLGDFAEYAALRRQIKERENSLAKQGAAQRRAAAADSLEKLRIGDVVMVPTGRRAGLAVVLDPGTQPLGEARPLVLTADRWAGRLSLADFTQEIDVLTRMRVPKHFNHRSPQARRDLASALRTAGADVAAVKRRKGRAAAADDDVLAELRAALRRHPCHGCNDREDHARWAERFDRLSRETHQLEQRVHNRTNSLARTFDQVCGLLESRGYLDGERVTDAGRGLARIWSESDLLVAECLRAGVWEGLSAPELAGAVSALVYEARRADESPAPVPNGPLRDTLAVIGRLASELHAEESQRGLSLTREPDYGFVWPAFRWARGEALERVLTSVAGIEGEMPAGDFVRWCRQVLDLLDQIAGAASAESGLRKTAREAIEATRRGIVAYTAVA